MIKKSPDFFFKRSFYASLFLMFVALLIAGRDTGVCYDELTQNVYGKANIAYYTSGGKDTSCFNPQFSDRDGAGTLHPTIKYYTSIFEYIGVGFNMLIGNIDGYEYNTRHTINQIIAIIGLLFTGLIARHITGNYRSALIAIWLLFLTPLFFGMALFNTKEIPFLAGYVATLYFSILFFEGLPKPSWKYAIGIMLSLFFTMGIRIGGVLLIMYIGLFGIIYWVTNSDLRASMKKHIPNWGLKIFTAIAGALILTVICWPFLLQDPLNNFIAALNVTTKFPQRIPVVFDGEITTSLDLPSGYLPKMMSFTIPALVLIGLAISIILLAVQLKGDRLKIFALLLFSSLFPIFYAEYTNASMYNSWRHFLFVYPGLVIITAVGFDFIITAIKKPAYKIAFGILLIVSMLNPIFWLFRTTPYQYTYFNEFTGGFDEMFHNYEKDYWFISVKEAADWLVEHEHLKESKDTVVIGTNSVAFAHYYFKRRYPQLKVKVVEIGVRGRNNTYWNYAMLGNFFIAPVIEENYFPPPQTIHTVDIDGMPVNAIVKDLHRYDYLATEAIQQNNFALSDSLYDLHLKEINYQPAVRIVDLGGIAGYIAYAKVAMNKFGEAKSLANNALVFNPQDYLGNVVLGMCFLHEGNKEAAKQYLTQAIKINPSDKMAKEYLSRIL